MGLGYFFGVNQSVSGNDWDDPNAPWRQEEPKYEVCPECGGDGGVFYNEAGDILSSVDYNKLSDEDKKLWEMDKCLRCDGSGEIEVEY